ncbi:MAG: hypothetical protein AAF125_10885 [Chloroflexota bacterium]
MSEVEKSVNVPDNAEEQAAFDNPPAEAAVVPEAVGQIEEQPDFGVEPQSAYQPPTGAFLFVILMGVFYVLYWIVAYLEIFVIRGS